MRRSLALLTSIAVGINAAPRAAPQGVSAAISPVGAAPPGCTAGYAGSFGVAVLNATGAGSGLGTVATQLADGQPAAGLSVVSVAPVSQISDAQPQAPTGKPSITVRPASQISDGQPQAGPAQPPATAAPVRQIGDGQVQAATAAATKPAVSQIGDGQVQAPTATVAHVTLTSNGQPQVKTAAAASQIRDGQPQNPAGPPSTGGGTLVGCETDSTLKVTLSNGVLKDSKGRVGYIAANRQFQFDSPPQAGAIYTSGFTVCANGTLALGGSNVFYQCLSGTFFNLYDQNVAAQCNAVTIKALTLKRC